MTFNNRFVGVIIKNDEFYQSLEIIRSRFNLQRFPYTFKKHKIKTDKL